MLGSQSLEDARGVGLKAPNPGSGVARMQYSLSGWWGVILMQFKLCVEPGQSYDRLRPA